MVEEKKANLFFLRFGEKTTVNDRIRFLAFPSLFIKSGAAIHQARSLWRIECFKIKYARLVVIINIDIERFLSLFADGTVGLLAGVR